MAEAAPARGDRDREETVQRAVEAAIRIGVIALLGLWVFNIVAPFIQPIVWGAIIAVAGGPPYHWLERRLGGRNVVAAVLFTLLALVLLITPTVIMTGALVEWGQGVAAEISEGRLAIPPAPESVRSWPVVGGPIYEFWSLANSNLQAALVKAQAPLENVGVWLLRSAASAGAGVLQFALSIVIAGAMLANSEGTRGIVDRFALRLAPETGRNMRSLAEQTVRGVATGVVGVAVVQCVLAGIGFYVVGIPGARLDRARVSAAGDHPASARDPDRSRDHLRLDPRAGAHRGPVHGLERSGDGARQRLEADPDGPRRRRADARRLRRRDRGLRVLRDRRAVRRGGRDGRRLRAVESLARSRAARCRSETGGARLSAKRLAAGPEIPPRARAPPSGRGRRRRAGAGACRRCRPRRSSR